MGLKEKARQWAKEAARRAGVDLTRNMRYDRLTSRIIAGHLAPDGVGIDVGAHAGDILKEFLQASPGQSHFAFEPIPELFQSLADRYGSRCRIYPFALGAEEGSRTFHIAAHNPAYSGLRRRDLGRIRPEFREVQVEVRRLDDVVPENERIDLIKLDVEGGEHDVLKGAMRLLQRWRPLLIFEFGRGAADHYGVTPAMMWSLLDGAGYEVFTLGHFLRQSAALDEAALNRHFEQGSEYYFVARRKA